MNNTELLINKYFGKSKRKEGINSEMKFKQKSDSKRIHTDKKKRRTDSYKDWLNYN